MTGGGVVVTEREPPPDPHRDRPNTRKERFIQGCCNKTPKLVKGFYPPGSRDELAELWVIAWPTIIASFFMFLPILTAVLFCGPLGREELDATALAISFINLTGLTIGLGLTTGLDTLMSQAWGGKNMHRIGVLLQRGIFVIMLFCFPCWALYLNIEGLMLAIGEPVDVAEYAGNYVNIFIPGLPGFILFNILSKFLQNQEMVKPPLVFAFMMNVVNIALHSILLFGFKTGIYGSSAAFGLSYWIASAALIIYIWQKRLHETCFPFGFGGRHVFQEWGMMMAMALPGLGQMAFEGWNYELGVLLSGRRGKDDLAAMGVTYQLVTLAFMIPWGMSIAASIRIGLNLGSGYPSLAKIDSRLSVTITVAQMRFMCLSPDGSAISVIAATIVALIYIIFSTDIPLLFIPPNNAYLHDYLSRLMPQIALSCWLDGFQGVGNGILRGCGKQKLGALINFVGFYIIGIPIGLSLMLATELRVAGFWWGTICGVFFQAVAFNILVMRIDWEKEEEKAKIRAGVAKRSDEVADKIDQLTSAPKSYSKEIDDVVIETPEEKAERIEQEKKATAVVTSQKIEADTNPFAEVEVTETSEQVPSGGGALSLSELSLRELFIRRGASIGIAVTFLFIGIILRLSIPLPHR